MQNQFLPATTTSVDAFVNAMAEIESGNEVGKPRPASVKLDGNSGAFSLRTWNKDLKQTESVPFQGGKEWQGTILFTRWFAQWKYKDGEKTRKIFRTDEFVSWDSPVELREIDYEKTADERTKTKGRYGSYREFKAVHGQKSTVSDAVTYPFDLWASLYVYVPALGQVVNYRIKGATRSNYFDYLQDYKTFGETVLRAKVEAKTKFSSEEKEMPSAKDSPAKKYYPGTFATVGVNNAEELTLIQRATMELGAWMQSDANGQLHDESLDETETPVPQSPALAAPSSPDDKTKLVIVDLVNRMGVLPKYPDDWKSSVRMLTGIELLPENYPAIVSKLEKMVQDNDPAAIKLEDIPF